MNVLRECAIGTIGGIYMAGNFSDLFQKLENLIEASHKLMEQHKRLADEQKKLLIELHKRLTKSKVTN